MGYDDGEVQMNEPKILEGGQARKEAKGAMRNEEVRALRDWFKQQQLRPNVKGAAAFEISYEGEYEEVNQGNPVIVLIPYAPRGKDEKRGGLLQLYMVDDGPQRVVGGVTAVYSEEFDEGVHAKYLGLDGDDVIVTHEETLASSFSASWSVKCATCEITFEAICTGTYGTVGVAGCSTICAASGPGWLACTPVCSTMVVVGTYYMCNFGASYFCSNMVDFC